jgi:hypothetical protein
MISGAKSVVQRKSSRAPDACGILRQADWQSAAGFDNLPRIAASRKRGVLDVSDIWPIDNRPQATGLPRNAGEAKIVAAREEKKM